MLLDGEASGYSNVKEVGCREPTSRPRNRLPRATCGEERRCRAGLVLTCSGMQPPSERPLQGQHAGLHLRGLAEMCSAPGLGMAPRAGARHSAVSSTRTGTIVWVTCESLVPSKRRAQGSIYGRRPKCEQNLPISSAVPFPHSFCFPLCFPEAPLGDVLQLTASSGPAPLPGLRSSTSLPPSHKGSARTGPAHLALARGAVEAQVLGLKATVETLAV